MPTRRLPSSAARWLGLGLVGRVLLGCSLTLDVDEQQCETTADCEARGPAFAGTVCRRRACVLQEPSSSGDGAGGASDAPNAAPLTCNAPEPTSSDTVTFRFAPRFVSGSEPAAPQPFSVRACEQSDSDCEQPLLGPIEVNAGEPYAFELPRGEAGFSGYFEITNPDTLGGLYFLGRPIVRDTAGWSVPLPSPAVFEQLALWTGEDIDPELGLISSVAHDCETLPLAGVSVTSTQGGLGYYFVMDVPDTSLTQTGPQGAAGFANVPLLATSLSGKHESGALLGPVAVRVKPGFISFAELFP